MSETSPYLGGTRVLAGSAEPDHYFGPYRGIVTNTTDPANQGRIKAIVPQIFGNSSTEIDWALPMILPGLLSLPTPGQGVWIQFEGGDINYPVWTGMWQAEPSVAPYEVAGAGASAVAQSEAYTKQQIAALPKTVGAQQMAVQTTTSATAVAIPGMTTCTATIGSSGDCLISISAQIATSGAASFAYVGLSVDGSTPTATTSMLIGQNENSNEWISCAAVGFYSQYYGATLTPGNHTFTLKFWNTTGGTTTYAQLIALVVTPL